MAIYTENYVVDGEWQSQLALSEIPLYGSRRVGIVKTTDVETREISLTSEGDNIFVSTDGTLTTPTLVTDYISRTLGNKMYELSNHLGKVFSTVSDRKLAYNASPVYFNADVLSYSDYYPFGMTMPGRNANVATYRHGFNGMEKDDELKGSGNSYDFGARVYDPRIGRWLAVDPFASKYYSWSPYNGMLNNPVRFIDRNGDSVEVIIGLPYTKNGNEHPYGHLALRVFNSTEGYDYVFDFGRYGNIWGLGGSSGDGVLNVYTSSENYKKSEQALRNSVGFIKPTTTEQDKQIIAYFQTLTDEGEKYKTGAVPGGGGTAYKLVDDYYALNNNCVTKSNEGLQLIGINWITGLYKPLDALEIMESLADAANLKRIEYQKGGKKIVTREIKDKQQQSNEIIQKIIDAGTAPQQDNTSPSTYGIPQTTTKEESNSSGG